MKVTIAAGKTQTITTAASQLYLTSASGELQAKLLRHGGKSQTINLLAGQGIKGDLFYGVELTNNTSATVTANIELLNASDDFINDRISSAVGSGGGMEVTASAGLPVTAAQPLPITAPSALAITDEANTMKQGTAILKNHLFAGNNTSYKSRAAGGGRWLKIADANTNRTKLTIELLNWEYNSSLQNETLTVALTADNTITLPQASFNPLDTNSGRKTSAYLASMKGFLGKSLVFLPRSLSSNNILAQNGSNPQTVVNDPSKLVFENGAQNALYAMITYSSSDNDGSYIDGLVQVIPMITTIEEIAS